MSELPKYETFKNFKNFKQFKKLKTLIEDISTLTANVQGQVQIAVKETENRIILKATYYDEFIGELEAFKFDKNPVENIAKDNEEYEFLNKNLNVKSVIEIDTLEVNPKYRKHGVGKLLVSKLKELAKDKNYDIIYLKARSFGEIPIPLTKLVLFYEALGFYTIRVDKKEHIMICDIKT